MTTTKILQTVCETFGVTESEIKSRYKPRPIAEARKVYFYISRRLTRVSWHSIGSLVNKDHATAMHGFKSCSELMEVYPLFKKQVNEIISELSNDNRGEKVKLIIQEIQIN